MAESECHTSCFCLLYFDSASEEESPVLRQTFHGSLPAILGGTEHSCRRQHQRGKSSSKYLLFCRTRGRDALDVSLTSQNSFSQTRSLCYPLSASPSQHASFCVCKPRCAYAQLSKPSAQMADVESCWVQLHPEDWYSPPWLAAPEVLRVC